MTRSLKEQTLAAAETYTEGHFQALAEIKAAMKEGAE